MCTFSFSRNEWNILPNKNDRKHRQWETFLSLTVHSTRWMLCATRRNDIILRTEDNRSVHYYSTMSLCWMDIYNTTQDGGKDGEIEGKKKKKNNNSWVKWKMTEADKYYERKCARMCFTSQWKCFVQTNSAPSRCVVDSFQDSTTRNVPNYSVSIAPIKGNRNLMSLAKFCCFKL